jgi:hypothetical protein
MIINQGFVELLKCVFNHIFYLGKKVNKTDKKKLEI